MASSINAATKAEIRRIGALLNKAPNRREYRAKVNLATGAQIGSALRHHTWQEILDIAYTNEQRPVSFTIHKSSGILNKARHIAQANMATYAGVMWSPHGKAGIALVAYSKDKLQIVTRDGIDIIEPLAIDATMEIAVIAWQQRDYFPPFLFELGNEQADG